jgi:hypothetical protein
MGSHQRTYVGPYLKVPGVHATKEVTSFTCSPGCKQKHTRKTAPFCSTCGHPIQEHTQTMQMLQEWKIDDLGTRFEGTLFQCLVQQTHANGVSFWMANTIDIGATFTRYDADKEYPLDANIIHEQCTTFANHYAKLIQAIKDQCGVEPSVCFGVISEMR